MPDRYTYQGTEVLRNKFGITDPLAAHELETRVAYQRLIEVSEHPIPGSFDLDHLQAIHRAVYSDLWEWAGEIRTVDTGTTNTGLAHCRPEFIRDQAGTVFGAIRADEFLRGMNHDTVTDRLAYHWGETTALHPFRDGNTRSQRLFFHQLTTEAGWSIDWNGINNQMDEFIRARLIAHAGNHEPLATLLAPHLRSAAGPGTAEGVAGDDLAAQIARLRTAMLAPPTSKAPRRSRRTRPDTRGDTRGEPMVPPTQSHHTEPGRELGD